MKQELTEALEGEHCNECGRLYGDTVYSVPDSVWAVIHERAPAGLLCPTCALDRLARLVERLLPGVCPTCGGVPNKIDRQTHLLTRCSDCHGSGQVWDEGIVEVVADQIALGIYNNEIDLINEWSRDKSRGVARAVLSALAEFLEKGE